MRRSEGIHWEFQSSSFVVLSCCILVCMCVRAVLVRVIFFFFYVSCVIVPYFCAHMSVVGKMPSRDTSTTQRQQSSFMSITVVKKNNGNKQPQSCIVMRLYFRAVAAPVWNSALFSVVVRQKMSTWTEGCFSQARKEVLWLWRQHHLSCMDTVNFPQFFFYSTSVLQQWSRRTNNLLDSLIRIVVV